MRFFSQLFFSPGYLQRSLQEEKLVGICASLPPSPGTINMQGPLPGKGPSLLRCRQGYGSRDARAGCAALQDGGEDEDGFLVR